VGERVAGPNILSPLSFSVPGDVAQAPRLDAGGRRPKTLRGHLIAPMRPSWRSPGPLELGRGPGITSGPRPNSRGHTLRRRGPTGAAFRRRSP
jgi:hypothetical protein